MRFPRSLGTLGLSCLLLGGCADTGGSGPDVYVVRPQDTLYSIAWRHDLDFRDLARWNNVGPDFRITVGQVLVLRRRASSPTVIAPRVAPKPPPALKPPPPSSSRPSPASRAAASSAPQGQNTPAPAKGVTMRWVWPTDRIGAPRPASGGGIILSGRLGQDVRSASAGRVVYTGSGLRGYGNLIIIKHADSLLSAYGHNREILVHEGQDVALGQVIAHMGEDAHQAAILYFEIRQNGRPVDPLAYLSKIK